MKKELCEFCGKGRNDFETAQKLPEMTISQIILTACFQMGRVWEQLLTKLFINSTLS